MKKYTQILKESYSDNVFETFLKCLSSLGFNPNLESDTPNDFIIFYRLPHLDSSLVKTIFGRFRSLSNIDFNYQTVGLYFGIKTDGVLSYGYYIHEIHQIGSYVLDKSKLNKIKLSSDKSLSRLRKDISDLSIRDLKSLSNCKQSLIKFNYGSKKECYLDDRKLIFKYYNVKSELEKIKSDFKKILIVNKISDHFLINAKNINGYTEIQLKLKDI